MNRQGQSYRPLRRRAAAIAAAVLATAATTGSVFALIDAATSVPWLPAEQAALVAHCDAARASTERRDCMQAVAERQAALRVVSR